MVWVSRLSRRERSSLSSSARMIGNGKTTITNSVPRIKVFQNARQKLGSLMNNST